MKVPFFRSALLLAGICLLVSCQKDISEFTAQHVPAAKTAVDKDKKPKVRDFKTTMEAYSYYYPDFEHGATPQNPFPGYSASVGRAISSGSGVLKNYANFYVTLGTNGSVEAHTIPLAQSPYPFYDELSAYFTPEEIDELKKNNLEEIGVDHQGNSVWSADGWYIGVPDPGNPTRLNITGGKQIVGGTGKYAGATGSYTFTGYSEMLVPQNLGDPSSIVWITAVGTITVDRD